MDKLKIIDQKAKDTFSIFTWSRYTVWWYCV